MKESESLIDKRTVPFDGSIVFLPWIKFDKQITVLGTTFTPWKAVESKRQSNKIIKHQMVRIFSQYILSPTRKDVDVLIAAVVLAFSCIAANQYFDPIGGYYINASCFNPIGQNFKLGEDGIAFRSKRRGGSTIDGGYLYKHLKTHAPSWIRQCRTFCIDSKVMEALTRCKIEQPKLYKRLYNSICWFLQSFTDDPALTEEMEIGSLESAFEHLQPEQMTAGQLCKIFSILLKDDGTGNYETPKAKWYYELKSIRDGFLHGGKKNRTLVPQVGLHLFIGTVTFVSTVKRILAASQLYVLSQDDEVDEISLDQFINKPDPLKWAEYRTRSRWEIVRRNAYSK